MHLQTTGKLGGWTIQHVGPRIIRIELTGFSPVSYIQKFFWYFKTFIVVVMGFGRRDGGGEGVVGVLFFL